MEKGGLLRHFSIGMVVLMAAALRLANISSLGYVNHYYAAAVESMLESWHNFFFAAAEPGGAVSVDKPPVGLWLQTISARIFGVNSFGLLLPEILAGLLSVLLIYHLVRRRFGTVAGLVAAVALAVSPVTVATDRNNTIDSILIFTLLLAAWAFIVAAERGGLRPLLAGAALIGLGFNIKMLEAYLPLPAFYATYLLGSPERLGRKAVNLVAATLVLAIVSLSWAVAVDLTPADQRPYVGSSGDNSVMSLAIGYNGTQRLLGMGRQGGLLSGLTGLFGGSQGGGPGGGGQPGNRAGGNQPPQNGGPSRGDGNNAIPGQTGGPQQPPSQVGGGQPQRNQGGPAGGGPGGGGGVMSGTGQTGPSRLFTGSMAKDIGWLLPLGIFGAALLAFGSRPRWPVAPAHQALLVWGGWLLVGGVFFSIAGFFHEYYLSIVAPPLAALVGISTIRLWRVHSGHRWVGAGLLLVAAGGTLILQVNTAKEFTKDLWWLPIVYSGLAIGSALLFIACLRRWRRAAIAAFGCVVLSLMATPAVWAALTNLNPSDNQSLPAAYGGRSSSPSNEGGLQLNRSLLDYLQAHTQDTKYLMAVPSSMQGADYVLATGRPVLYLGGFMGQDNVASPDDLSAMVARGELRYVYWNNVASSRSGSQTGTSSWVAENCTAIEGFDTQTQNSGAPDGTSAGASANGGPQGGGNMRITLYQCSTPTTSP